MQLFLFSLKMSITVLSFYWRNDTQSFLTWRSRLATAPDTPTCIVIHCGQFTGGVHTPSQFVPEIVSPLPCSPALVRPTLLIVYFFKELISFIGSLDKCQTGVFNALINNGLGIRTSLPLFLKQYDGPILIALGKEIQKPTTVGYEQDRRSTL